MAYQIVITKKAAKELAALAKDRQRLIDKRIRSLADDPRPEGSKKLQGRDDLYRIRAGDYRIVYKVDDDEEAVTILRIRHRRDVYRDL